MESTLANRMDYRVLNTFDTESSETESDLEDCLSYSSAAGEIFETAESSQYESFSDGSDLEDAAEIDSHMCQSRHLKRAGNVASVLTEEDPQRRLGVKTKEEDESIADFHQNSLSFLPEGDSSCRRHFDELHDGALMQGTTDFSHLPELARSITDIDDYDRTGNVNVPSLHINDDSPRALGMHASIDEWQIHKPQTRSSCLFTDKGVQTVTTGLYTCYDVGTSSDFRHEKIHKKENGEAIQNVSSEPGVINFAPGEKPSHGVEQPLIIANSLGGRKVSAVADNAPPGKYANDSGFSRNIYTLEGSGSARYLTVEINGELINLH